MNTKSTAVVLGAALVLAFGLAGCSTADNGSSTPEPSSIPSETATAGASDAALATAESSLGEIIVDGRGHTLYMFDNDTQGAGRSVCEGECATNWPAVTTDVASPVIEGITGEIGTIVGVDGDTQVTVNGWPLYYFAGDSSAGDTAGQGVGGVWWVLSPAGERITG